MTPEQARLILERMEIVLQERADQRAGAWFLFCQAVADWYAEVWKLFYEVLATAFPNDAAGSDIEPRGCRAACRAASPKEMT